MDTQIISLDIETYGAVEEGIRGNLLPKQTVFHPAKSMHTDGVDLSDLIITASITLVKEDQCCTATQTELWIEQDKKLTKSQTKTSDTLQSQSCQLEERLLPNLKNLKPQQSMVFDLADALDRERLRKWLRYSTTIVGMNLPFDIQYLRKDPYFKFELENQLLIDLSIVNYLHDETRPEKSLKNLGPILRTHAYTSTLKEERFKTARDKELYNYNAQDTHNTILAVRELARRIENDFPNSDKLSVFCIEFYSDLLWTIIRMSEAGICMNKKELEKLEDTLTVMCKEANDRATETGYPLEGEGSGVAKQQLMDDAINLIGDRIRNEMELTPAKGLVSFTEGNRNKLQNALRGDIEGKRWELTKVLDAAKIHAGAQKIISSYTYPLLRHRRNKPIDCSSCIVPINGHHIAYPTWYAIPTTAKNNAGGEGGTLQGRITCKKPSAQTFPPQIKKCITSRFKEGKVISMDLSQIELRVAGLLSGDKAFINAYQNGEDLHEQRARQCFNDVDENFYARRQAAKMINFADLFRAGATTMQKQLLAMTGMEFKLVFLQKIVGTRRQHRPQLWAFQNELIMEANASGRVSLPFTGQSRYFMGGEKYEVNEIVNFPIQTTASNTLLSIQSYIHKGMASMNAKNPDILMFLNVYDAIYFDVRNKESEDNIKYLVEKAVEYVQNEGYWGMISEHYGNEIPLEYDWS